MTTPGEDSGTGYRGIRWDALYDDGTYQTNWDTEWPSPELAGYLAATGWNPGAVSVDLGCGSGADAIYLATLGFESTGVDISESAIAFARERAGDDVSVTWLVADACALPLADGSVDLVTDRGCLHHFTHSDWGDYAREVARVLRPGGTLLVRGMSEEHRNKNILRDDYVRVQFDTDVLRVVRTIPYRMVGPTAHSPALMFVVERR